MDFDVAGMRINSLFTRFKRCLINQKKKTGISISLSDVIESDCNETLAKIIAKREVILAQVSSGFENANDFE